MSAKEHRDAADQGPVDVLVGVVSTSRREADDKSGQLVQLLLEGAGHRVIARVVVPDDVAEIQSLVRRAQGEARVLVLSGGTGVSRLDVTPEALAPLFDRTLPGFGELFRMLSFREVGAAAMLSRATAGFVGSLLVFAVPGSPAAARLAVEELILPELAHLLREATKEGRAPAPPAGAAPEPVRLVPPPPRPAVGLGRLDAAAAAAEIDPDAERTGWMSMLETLDGSVQVDARVPLPPEIEKMAPVMNVLAQGARGAITLAGRGACPVVAFPDFGPHAKVLLLGSGGPWPEVVALHRRPIAGTTALGGLLPYVDALDQVAREVTGRAPPGGGRVFAVQADAIWIERDLKVLRWDGSKLREEGRVAQVLASLVLAWSRR